MGRGKLIKRMSGVGKGCLKGHGKELNSPSRQWGATKGFKQGCKGVLLELELEEFWREV